MAKGPYKSRPVLENFEHLGHFIHQTNICLAILGIHIWLAMFGIDIWLAINVPHVCPYFTPKVRKFATKIISRQNSIIQYCVCGITHLV